MQITSQRVYEISFLFINVWFAVLRADRPLRLRRGPLVRHRDRRSFVLFHFNLYVIHSTLSVFVCFYYSSRTRCRRVLVCLRYRRGAISVPRGSVRARLLRYSCVYSDERVCSPYPRSLLSLAFSSLCPARRLSHVFANSDAKYFKTCFSFSDRLLWMNDLWFWQALLNVPSTVSNVLCWFVYTVLFIGLSRTHTPQKLFCFPTPRFRLSSLSLATALSHNYETFS